MENHLHINLTKQSFNKNLVPPLIFTKSFCFLSESLTYLLKHRIKSFNLKQTNVEQILKLLEKHQQIITNSWSHIYQNNISS